eukprot:6497943-Prymnesium_polylepis.1
MLASRSCMGGRSLKAGRSRRRNVRSMLPESTPGQMAGQRNHGQGHVFHHCASDLHDQKQQHDGDSTAQVLGARTPSAVGAHTESRLTRPMCNTGGS